MGAKGSKEAPTPAADSPAPPAPAKESGTKMTDESQQRLDAIRAAVEKKGGDMPDVLRDGRYRIASQETTDNFYAQQPASIRMQSKVPKEMEGMTASEVKRYLTDTEGLNLGSHRMKELTQQWRLLLASDAVQHGLDAGILLGTATAAGNAMLRPAKRHPLIVAYYFCLGYAAGVVGFPMALMGYEQYYTAKIIGQEQEMFAQQRAEFYNRAKEARDARDPNL